MAKAKVSQIHPSGGCNVEFLPTTKTRWVEIALGRMETHFPLQQCSLPPNTQKCAVLSTSVLRRHPWWKRQAAAAATAAVALGGGNQIAPFLHHLAAEASGHKEDDVLVQKQLGYVTLKVVSKMAIHWGVRFLCYFPR